MAGMLFLIHTKKTTNFFTISGENGVKVEVT